MKLLTLTTALFAFNFFNLNAANKSETAVTALGFTQKYLWIGTENGIYKIGRTSNKRIHYTTSNSKLPSNKINKIAIGTDDNVWIATSAGLLHYDGSSYVALNSDNSPLPKGNIVAMVADRRGNIWLSVENIGIVVIVMSQKFILFNTGNSKLCCDSITKLNLQENGDVIAQDKQDHYYTLNLTNNQLSSVQLKPVFCAGWMKELFVYTNKINFVLKFCDSVRDSNINNCLFKAECLYLNNTGKNNTRKNRFVQSDLENHLNKYITCAKNKLLLTDKIGI